jgi:hypothetical protein
VALGALLSVWLIGALHLGILGVRRADGAQPTEQSVKATPRVKLAPAGGQLSNYKSVFYLVKQLFHVLVAPVENGATVVGFTKWTPKSATFPIGRMHVLPFLPQGPAPSDFGDLSDDGSAFPQVWREVWRTTSSGRRNGW